MKHMMTFRKFRFLLPTHPGASANKITKDYKSTFKNLPCKKFPFTFQILLETTPPVCEYKNQAADPTTDNLSLKRGWEPLHDENLHTTVLTCVFV